MNERTKKALDRLKDTISDIESWDRSFWNISQGTNHLTAYAEQVVNDAKTLASHLKSYGRK